MARARAKQTSPAKKGKTSPAKKRVPAAKKHAAKAPRAPRSTQRSALEEKTLPHRLAQPIEIAKMASVTMGPQAAPNPGARMAPSPVAISVARITTTGEVHPSSPGVSGHVMELNWGDEAPSSRRTESLVQRWVKRGDALLRRLAEHGAAKHEYRADLRDGRFVWIDPTGRVSAEASARVICSWSRSTSALVMAWADLLVRSAGVSRLDGVPAERDDVDEESAWRVAMEAAEQMQAEYLYRVTAPHAWYFLALGNLTFHPERASFSPSTPVGLVLRGVAETLHAIESRAEPADVVRERLSTLGHALLHEAEYAYRGTDWVARLTRAGRRLVQLAEQLPRASFTSIAAGRHADEWLSRDATIELSDALALLEDEWALFA